MSLSINEQDKSTLHYMEYIEQECIEQGGYITHKVNFSCRIN